MAVKKRANPATAAKVRALSNRSHRLTNVRQFFGGALGCQSNTAELMGAVPRSVSKKLVSITSSPAKRKAKPGSTPSRTVMTIPRRIVGTKMTRNQVHNQGNECNWLIAVVSPLPCRGYPSHPYRE